MEEAALAQIAASPSICSSRKDWAAQRQFQMNGGKNLTQDIFVAIRRRFEKRAERSLAITAFKITRVRRHSWLRGQVGRTSTTRVVARRDPSCQIVTCLPVWLHS